VTDYKGVTGPVSFDETGDIKNGALTLKTVRGGKLETLAVIRKIAATTSAAGILIRQGALEDAPFFCVLH